MLYLIDSGNAQEIEEALMLGARGVTANTSMYRKNDIRLHDFVNGYSNRELDFLSGEVIGTYEEMLQQTEELLALYSEIVIKINFSKDGLHLADTLHKRGVKTAMTLIFTMGQAVAAINVHVDYLFFFIGRNEEYGSDAMRILSNIQEMIAAKRYPVKTVAASIKNLAQLEKLAAMKVDYAAIPYTLYMKSLEHPLTDSGALTFEDDFYLR